MRILLKFKFLRAGEISSKFQIFALELVRAGLRSEDKEKAFFLLQDKKLFFSADQGLYPLDHFSKIRYCLLFRREIILKNFKTLKYWGATYIKYSQLEK